MGYSWVDGLRNFAAQVRCLFLEMTEWCVTRRIHDLDMGRSLTFLKDHLADKEQFSNGVGYSWMDGLREYAAQVRSIWL